jgi:hypothetical protein
MVIRNPSVVQPVDAALSLVWVETFMISGPAGLDSERLPHGGDDPAGSHEEQPTKTCGWNVSRCLIVRPRFATRVISKKSVIGASNRIVTETLRPLSSAPSRERWGTM